MCRQYIISGEISLAAQPVLEKHAPTIWRSLSMSLWINGVMSAPVGECKLLEKNKPVDAGAEWRAEDLPAPVAAADAKQTNDGGLDVALVDAEQVQIIDALFEHARARAAASCAPPSSSLTSAPSSSPFSRRARARLGPRSGGRARFHTTLRSSRATRACAARSRREADGSSCRRRPPRMQARAWATSFWSFLA